MEVQIGKTYLMKSGVRIRVFGLISDGTLKCEWVPPYTGTQILALGNGITEPFDFSLKVFQREVIQEVEV